MDKTRTDLESPLNEFVSGIKAIIDDARRNAVRSVDFCRVRMYWAIGQRIAEKEQQGKERALTLSRISRSNYNRSMAADSLPVNWRCADNSIEYTQMRIHCVRN